MQAHGHPDFPSYEDFCRQLDSMTVRTASAPCLLQPAETDETEAEIIK